MVVVVTRDVADRFRSFLASAMPEIAPGVCTAPRKSKGVRERV
jgi:CRISPR-associated protein Cas2